MTLKRNNNTNTSNRKSWSRRMRSRILEGGEDDNCIVSTTRGTDNLDNNLLGEILIRLPTETIDGLKCINKNWYNLISDPFFINKHNSLRTIPRNFFYGLSSPGRITQVSIDPSSPNHLSVNTISFGEKYDSAYIYDSCHGLLLVRLKRYVSKMDSHSCISTLCIINPLTKKKKFIPSRYKSKSCSYRLVFGPTPLSSPYYYNQYSVVCLVESRAAFEFKIFMPERRRWRDCNESTRISFGNGLKEDKITLISVCFRWIIHWLTINGYIIAFNLDKEESRMIKIPKSVFEMVESKDNWWFSTWLGVVEDELNLVVTTQKHEIVTWVLCDYENNKWKMKRKDVIKMESNAEVSIQPMFFNGEKFLLNFRRYIFSVKNNWQEYDIHTGVLRSLHSDAPCYSKSHISALTEV